MRDIKRLVIILDERYYYDQNRYLRSKYLNKEGSSDVRNLFHQLNQAKEELSIIVRENTYVYETLLTLLQPDTVRYKLQTIRLSLEIPHHSVYNRNIVGDFPCLTQC